MRIYFSCSLTGGRQDQPIYAGMVRHLQGTGHEVLTAHLADPEVMVLDGLLDPLAVYERDTAWIKECDVVIAEVSTPSHGVGFEIAFALGRGKPVFCFFRAGARVSKMITGNRSPGFEVRAYDDPDHAASLMDAGLASLQAP